MNEDSILLTKFETKIFFPFYFKNINKFYLEKTNSLELIEKIFKDSINNSLSQFISKNECKNFFEIDFKKNFFIIKEEVTAKVNSAKKEKYKKYSFKIIVSQLNPLKRIIDSFDIFFNFNKSKKIIEGGISINLFNIVNLSFDQVLDKIFLSKIAEKFFKTKFLPLSFNNLLGIANEEHENYYQSLLEQKYFDGFNSKDFKKIDFNLLHKVWKNIMEENFEGSKLNEEKFNYYKNDLFYSFVNIILLNIIILKNIEINLFSSSSNDIFSLKKFILSKFDTLDKKSNFFDDFKYLIDILNSMKENNTCKNVNSKRKFLKQISKHYQKKEDFISDVFIFYNCEYNHLIDKIFQDHVLNKEFMFHNKKIEILNDILLFPEKYNLCKSNKIFSNQEDFKTIVNFNLNNNIFKSDFKKNFFTINEKQIILSRNKIMINIYDKNNGFQSIQNLLKNYYWAIIFMLTRINTLFNIEQYINFVSNIHNKNKSLEYRIILKDLKKIELHDLQIQIELESIIKIMNFIDNQLQFSFHLDNLIKKVRSEDEIGKLIAERDSIATGFIVALFVSLMWFVDATFAIFQSTGSGTTPPGPLQSATIISSPLFYGFVGFTTLILATTTTILIYTLLKMLIKRRHEIEKGIQNFY